jgi:hypothetical protein
MRAESGRKTVDGTGATQAGHELGRIFSAAILGVALVWMAGCHKNAPDSSSSATPGQDAGDPANANMATVNGNQAPAQVLGQNAQYSAQQSGEDYSQQPPAPVERVAPGSGQPAPGYDNGGQLSDQQAADLYSSDLTNEQASDPPPPLPEYDQPPAPEPDDLWTPGYWGWGSGGYYWVPGAWVAAPYTGALWTPGYWGFVGGYYRFHHGFWGPHIGFYGGVNYGFGYIGTGYVGGYWNHDHFFYNSAVTRVNVNVIHNVYVHNVIINNNNRVSFNGGRGGIQARPAAAEVAVLHEQRIPPMASQVQVQREAAQNKAQFYSANKGRPAIAVAARPVAADRALPAALPRVAGPVGQPAARPGQPAPGVRPEPGAQVRNAPEAGRPGSEARPVPNAINRAAPAVQERPTPQARPVPQPQAREVQPQARPVQPQPEARPAPQEQTRPQPAPHPAARPQPEARPAPHPQPQARPAPHPAPAPQPHEEEKPKR